MLESRLGRTFAEKLQALVKAPAKDALEKAVKQAAQTMRSAS